MSPNPVFIKEFPKSLALWKTSVLYFDVVVVVVVIYEFYLSYNLKQGLPL